MPDIIESPVVKIVFCDYLWISSLVLGALTGHRFEGDKTIVSIPVPEDVEITFFFWNWDFRVHILLMMLLPDFFLTGYQCDFSILVWYF